MCGIAGIVGGGRAAQLDAMLDAMRPRGPDDRGRWEGSAPPVLLGHLRLSIIDLSPSGHQPMHSADGALTIVFNSELYNYLELRAELADYPFRTQSDTEVILAAWQRWGPAALDRFLGMFAFALWDAPRQTLTLVRDRFGVKPLYFARMGAGLTFASEIKALHAGGLPARPSAAAWATYLALGHYDHAGYTFWEGAESLPPGHLLTWRDGRTQVQAWYDLAARVVAEGTDQRSDLEVEDELA